MDNGQVIHDLTQSVERVKELCAKDPLVMRSDEHSLIQAYDALWSALQSLHKAEAA